MTARAKMAVAGSPYGQQRNSDVCALIGGEQGQGCVLIGLAGQPPARICTASLGPLRDRLWAGQRQGRIPSAMFGFTKIAGICLSLSNKFNQSQKGSYS